MVQYLFDNDNLIPVKNFIDDEIKHFGFYKLINSIRIMKIPNLGLISELEDPTMEGGFVVPRINDYNGEKKLDFELKYSVRQYITSFTQSKEFILNHELFHIIHYGINFEKMNEERFRDYFDRSNFLNYFRIEVIAQYFSFKQFIEINCKEDTAKEVREHLNVFSKVSSYDLLSLLRINYLLVPLRDRSLMIIKMMKDPINILNNSLKINDNVILHLGYDIGNWLAIHEYVLNKLPSNLNDIYDRYPEFRDLLKNYIPVQTLSELNQIITETTSEIKEIKNYLISHNSQYFIKKAANKLQGE